MSNPVHSGTEVRIHFLEPQCVRRSRTVLGECKVHHGVSLFMVLLNKLSAYLKDMKSRGESVTLGPQRKGRG
jgi:hypothetical protein